MTQAAQTLASYELQQDLTSQPLFRALFGTNGLDQRSIPRAYYNSFLEHLKTTFDKASSEYKYVGGSKCSEQHVSFVDFQLIAAAICSDTSQNKISLTELGQSLVSQDLVMGEPDQFDHTQQLVFAAIGWISMLFVPSTDFVSGCLVIGIHEGSAQSRRFDTWTRSTQSIERITGTLGDILRDFGNDGRGPLSCIGDASEPPPMLTSSNLNYYVLAKLGGLQIRWVDSACMHLELNRRNKTLMLFRHASICALMSQATYLDWHYFEISGQGLPAFLEANPAGAFFREILLTYRLLFGQHKRSWRLFRSTGGIPAPTSATRWFPWARRSQNPGADAVDSLLYKLCCADSSYETLYDHLGAPDIRSVYSAQQDFPFFGDRLVALQEYVRLLDPTDLRSLYYDRRDLTRFYSLWTTIAFGFITFLLTILGVLLAAGQIAAAFRPN